MIPTVINISNGSTRAGSQRAIHSFMRFDSLTRAGYSPNSMAIHPAMSATTSQDTQPVGSSQLIRMRVA